jgi:predicted dehydrogenase
MSYATANRPAAEPRVAVVGYGSIGRRHVENLGRLGVSRPIIIRRPRPNPAFAPPAWAEVVSSSREAIDRGLDWAIVCVPTSLHVETALEFIESGVPVLLEKPVAHRLDEAERLCAAARRRASVGMAYCLRWHPAYRLARRVVRSGRLGRLSLAEAWSLSYLPDWHPWEDYRQNYAARRELGGGVLPTLDHEIDFLNWCLSEPRAVRGVSSRSGLLQVDCDDRATLTVDYAGGVTATVTLSMCSPVRRRGFSFQGADGSLSYDFESERLVLAANNGPPRVLFAGQRYDVNDMYLAMLADTLAARSANRRWPVDLAAGLANLRIACQVRSDSPAA